jgi:hypothetical protein
MRRQGRRGILFWQVDHNLDQRKAWHLVQFSVFRDEAAFERFRARPAHKQMNSISRETADWVVGDILSTVPVE